MCLDPKGLSKVRIHEHYKYPTIEEITDTLAGSTTYSKLDAGNWFWSIHLTYKSSLLTTFNTHLGRYPFKCMTFRLKMSQDMFHMKMDEIVERCPIVLCIHDNFSIYGYTN